MSDTASKDMVVESFHEQGTLSNGSGKAFMEGKAPHKGNTLFDAASEVLTGKGEATPLASEITGERKILQKMRWSTEPIEYP